MSKKFAPDFYKLDWYFLFGSKLHKFPTCDRPVIYNKLKCKDTWVLFPISSEVCLLLSNHLFSIDQKLKMTQEGYWQIVDQKWKMTQEGYWQIDDKSFESIREVIVGYAIEEIYYHKKSEWLVKYVNNRLSINTFNLRLSQIVNPL